MQGMYCHIAFQTAVAGSQTGVCTETECIAAWGYEILKGIGQVREGKILGEREKRKKEKRGREGEKN